MKLLDFSLPCIMAKVEGSSPHAHSTSPAMSRWPMHLSGEIQMELMSSSRTFVDLSFWESIKGTLAEITIEMRTLATKDRMKGIWKGFTSKKVTFCRYKLFAKISNNSLHFYALWTQLWHVRQSRSKGRSTLVQGWWKRRSWFHANSKRFVVRWKFW